MNLFFNRAILILHDGTNTKQSNYFSDMINQVIQQSSIHENRLLSLTHSLTIRNNTTSLFANSLNVHCMQIDWVDDRYADMVAIFAV